MSYTLIPLSPWLLITNHTFNNSINVDWANYYVVTIKSFELSIEDNDEETLS